MTKPYTRERFEEKFFVAEDGCWLWLGAVNHDGYGVISVNNKIERAHRLSYEQHIGQIPEGLQIDHLCRQRSCVNPSHLEPVTRAENNRRKPGITICEHGVGRSKCQDGCGAEYGRRMAGRRYALRKGENNE